MRSRTWLALAGLALLLLAGCARNARSISRWWDPHGPACPPCGDPCDPCDSRGRAG